jgi:multidrug resistance efflux pump
VLLALVLVTACRRAPAAALADDKRPAMTVTRGSLEDRYILTGEIEAVTSENLGVPRTPAWILAVRWLIDDGTYAKKGDPVAEFDSTAFSGTLDDKRLAVTRGEGELTAARAAAEAANADKSMDVSRRQADLDKAAVEAAVPADLFSRRDFQEKQLKLNQQKDALAKARADEATTRRSGKLDVALKAVALARARRELGELEDRLAELTVRAPRDGLIQISTNRRENNRKYQVGDQAFAGWTIAAIPDLSRMQVRARLPDVDDGAVAEGMRASCVLDAFPDRVFPGVVAAVSPVARAEGRDSTRRFFDVVVTLEKADGSIMRPGMSMRVDVVRRRASDVLMVPRVAVRIQSGKAQVRLAGGRDAAVEVEWCTPQACVVRGPILEGAALLATAEGGPR